MSSSKYNSQLAKWLLQLNAYRNAMDTTASSALETLSTKTISGASRIETAEANPVFAESDASFIATKTETNCEVETALPVDPACPRDSKFLAVESPVEERQVATSPVAQPGSQVVHLPIDGILKRIQRSKSFVLGVGTVGDSDPLLVRSVVSELITRCCGKTNRNAILVTVRTPNDITSADFPSCGLYHEARWSYFDQTKTETRAWHAQLSELPRWKQEFGLIVFDLGDVGFPLMPRIGRLCDGIVVQLLDPSNSRETIQALKRLQKDRLTILGAWSVDLCLQHFAA